jgi:hypothetical protein
MHQLRARHSARAASALRRPSMIGMVCAVAITV